MHFMKQWLRWPVPRIAAVLAVLGGLTACDVNAVPRQDEAVKAAWSQVLNQYQRRTDLIPNLVETVKGYAHQEQQELVAVTEARAMDQIARQRPRLGRIGPRVQRV